MKTNLQKRSRSSGSHARNKDDHNKRKRIPVRTKKTATRTAKKRAKRREMKLLTQKKVTDQRVIIDLKAPKTSRLRATTAILREQ